MREQELADALARGPGGIQINITRKGCTVSTYYQPSISKKGPKMMDALLAVSREIWQKGSPKAVIKALEDYDEHTAALRI